ncbi:plant intracellular Ras-group-related LRR protein 7-like [Camellia sinensis]|uniref:plant intracellular Ras-group-related LRR protein 7-like n=1 Tax=Camellia sinensis TaxID=4442 RepID=UPI00103600A6|nr:plant intracellular Ras-group-related LRR protein 7-like [Camellia sinensis]
MKNCNVSYLPSEIGSLISLNRLFLDGNNLCTLPDSIGNLTRLLELGMNNCNLSHLPCAIWKLNSLVSLYLIGNNLRTIPNDICKLTYLRTLYLSGCARLQSIPELPKSIRIVTAIDCVSLENIELKWLVGVHHPGAILRLKGCHKLAESNFVNNVMKAAIQQVKVI